MLDFLETYYLVFIIVSIILIFALIGFFARKKKGLDSPYESIKNNKANNKNINMPTNNTLNQSNQNNNG